MSYFTYILSLKAQMERKMGDWRNYKNIFVYFRINFNITLNNVFDFIENWRNVTLSKRMEEIGKALTFNIPSISL